MLRVFQTWFMKRANLASALPSRAPTPTHGPRHRSLMRRTAAVSVALGCGASALLASAPAAQAMGGVCNGIPGYSHKGGDAATAAGHSWNTVRAFADAYAVGMDGVETDAQPDADGDILMFHNSTLDKVTDGTGPVADSSTAYMNFSASS